MGILNIKRFPIKYFYNHKQYYTLFLHLLWIVFFGMIFEHFLFLSCTYWTFYLFHLFILFLFLALEILEHGDGPLHRVGFLSIAEDIDNFPSINFFLSSVAAYAVVTHAHTELGVWGAIIGPMQSSSGQFGNFRVSRACRRFPRLRCWRVSETTRVSVETLS